MNQIDKNILSTKIITVFKEIILVLIISSIFAIASWKFHPDMISFKDGKVLEGEITINEALKNSDSIIWVDARNREKFDEGHITNAKLLNEDDWDNLLFDFMQIFDPDKKIVVYCDSGGCHASKNVAQRLRNELQIDNIYTLKGGWDKWLQKKKEKPNI